jgi:DNA helicase-2/ATP-dependent DNA helicase PcrA
MHSVLYEKAAMDLLRDLTPAQQQAVMHIDGPLLVLAGPGSGKTRVITRRVVYLLQSGIKPWNILAITFTNKAAGEMRKRVADLVPNHRVQLSTFHSLGVRLLRQYADRLELNRNFTIFDQSDREAIIKEALGSANVDSVSFNADRVQAAISKAKNELKSPEAYARTARDYFQETIAKVYPLYEQRMRSVNAMDFDDLLYWLAVLLRQFPDAREELDARFRYIMIDEYQDTNYAQYVIAKHLSQDYPNLCVVGDPDQSIYKFRGSDIRNILDFERDFPEAKIITLDRNYRSTKTILAAADSLIAHNRKRKPKTLVTENQQGERIQLLMFASGLDEAQGLAKHVKALVANKGYEYHDIAIFLRMNALSRALETAFIKNRIPYQIVRGLAFFERKENKDVLAYLRLLVNPQDDLSFRRAVNVPARGVGETSLGRLEEYALGRDISMFAAALDVEKMPEIKGKAAKGLQEFSKLIAELRSMLEQPAGDVIRALLDRSGYRKMLQGTGDPDDLERLANVEELITAANEFETEAADRTEGEVNRPASEGGSLAAFLEHITLRSDQDALKDQVDQVAIMTLHAAKGLEFPVVIMPALEQGILPHERSLDKHEELEEERRLAFVGITRAKKELILSHAEYREFRGANLSAIPSPFLDELPKDVIKEQRIASELDKYLDADSDVYEKYRVDRPDWRGTAPSRRGRSEKPSFASLKTGAELAGLSTTSPGKKDINAFKVGATVKHDTYGLGSIKEVSGLGAGRRVKVRFGSGERTFILEKAPLRVV